MQPLHKQLENKSRILSDLDYREASDRLKGLLEWMESEPDVKSVLEKLDAEVDGMALLNAADYHHPPRAATELEIAAVGLALMRAAKDHPFYQIVTVKGIHASGSSKFNDHIAAAIRRYLAPFVDFVLQQLPESSGSTLEASASNPTSENMKSSDVFIVHGRDAGPKEIAARFIERLGLNAIILHEQSNRGRTIIEKFEDHAEVHFAVVILTPDDIGRLKKDAESESRPRARQNVVFEMGYFIGRIGRDKVFLLRIGDVELPSDYAGIVYTEMDARGAWKGDLIRELKAARFVVDVSKAFD